MAVTGFHNVSVFDSSFIREPQSPQSRQWGEQNGPSTRASSLLQMWRELEGEHVVNHPNMRFGEGIQRQRSERSNTDSVSTFVSDGQESFNGNESLESSDVQNECSTYSQIHVSSENEHDDSNSVGSEQSADLGEGERERVRQIFREWMNSGAKSHSPSVSHTNNHSRAQWLGENERERVRIIMEWVQVNCQQRGNCDSPTDEGASEVGQQIDLVRDGLLVNHGELCERKTIRKLCGRQALLDLLTRAQRERKRELQELSDHRPVSNFTHRNRIQSLLRGRFLRNERIIQDERPTSRAVSELGLLRQTHAVSDLREGFLSRSDNSVRGSSNNSQSGDASSNEEHHSYGNGQLLSDEEQEILEDIYDLFEPSDEEGERIDFPAQGIDFDRTGETNQQHSVITAAEEQVQIIGQGDQGQELVSNVDYAVEGRESMGNWQANANALLHETSEIETNAQGLLLVADDLFQEQDVASSEVIDAHEVGGNVEDGQVNDAEELNLQETSAQIQEGQESALDHEELEWQQLTSIEADEWADGNEEGLSGMWQENIANQWDQGRANNDFGEHQHSQEPHEDWHDDGLQEAIDSWLDVPSGQGVGSIGRIDSFYFPEDDNAHSMELRELLSRRRVSSLLRSGFRASLDQMIQSYVERQGNNSMDWEVDGTSSSPAFNEQDQEQQNGVQVQDGDPSSIVDRTSPSETASQSLWDHDLHRVNWSHNSPHPRLGIQEWEIINELRVDMVRLQQRMNSMQRMLEACMDMQLELQRSVRQEVSAALNRPAVSTDTCKDDPRKDDSKWDFVRKGICCMCCEQNIDSLLYRCGHMCTCSRCAEKLVQGKDKCPMCRAPVIEAVRAYSIQ